MKHTAPVLTVAACVATLGLVAHAEIIVEPSYEDLNAAADQNLFGEGLPGENLPRDMARLACDVLLDAIRVGNEVAVIGQRGHVLKIGLDQVRDNEHAFNPDKICDRSSAEHRVWKQQNFPSRAYLNAASFPTPTLGWVVGHDASIFNTTDAGATWEKQFADPELEKPFLDVLFTDAQNGHAVGAFGLYYTTSNAGKSWEDQEALYIDPEFEEADDFHINTIDVLGDGTLFAAGEQGVLYRKSPDADAWEKLEGDYEGSYFGVIPYGYEGVIVYGLRGNVYVSRDKGDSWDKMETGSTSTFLGGAALPNGEVAIGGAKGTLFVSQGGGRRLVEIDNPNDGAITGILPVGANRLVMTTDQGVKTIVLQ